MSFNSAIWRASGASLTEAAASSANKVEFNEEPIVTNNAIMESEFDIRCDIAENERPKSGLNELQDNGVGGVDVIVTGSIKGQQTSDDVQNLITWLVEDKTESSTTPYGRFGLRLDDFPFFNVVPSATSGYILQNVKFIRDGETAGRVRFVLTLRLNGTASVLL